MAIILKTKTPRGMIISIRKMIDSGEIDTWSYDKDGDFTHTGQWANKAWFTPKIEDEKLTFLIVGRKNVNMTLMEYSIYHGRFVELLLNHFPQEMHSLLVTAPLQTLGDCSRITF